MLLGKPLTAWCNEYPLLNELIALRETSWFNPGVAGAAEALADVGLTRADVTEASARLARFAPYIARAFPETAASAGIIESGIRAVPHLQTLLAERYGLSDSGALWLKQDSHLPISGSIKARGGIYEVLKHAEDLALTEGLLQPSDDYGVLDSDAARAFFGRYKIAVGSTGNLGLSIGIVSARLGFQATVHMSADARQWKKDKLRAHGVSVVEYACDYSVAVAEGASRPAPTLTATSSMMRTRPACSSAMPSPRNACNNSSRPPRSASMPSTRCSSTCPAASAAARAGWPSASSWRLAMRCIACLPSPPIRPAC